MAGLKHNIEYYALLSLVKAGHLLTPRAADRMGAALGSIAHAVLTSRRRVTVDNLTRAMGDSLSQDEIATITKEVFRNLGRTLIEFSRLPKTGAEGIKKIVIPEGEDILRRVLKEGKGGIIATPHFGNWEMEGAWYAASGYPIDFYIGTQHNPRVNEMLVGFRRSTGAGIISLAKSLRSAFKSLKEGRLGALTPDQHDPSAKMIMDFFGRPASMAKGPAVLAIRAGCPIVPVLMRRERYDRHVLTIGEPIYPPASGDEEADIRTMTAAYFSVFEAGIRQHPDQWMWTHRRWKV